MFKLQYTTRRPLWLDSQVSQARMLSQPAPFDGQMLSHSLITKQYRSAKKLFRFVDKSGSCGPYTSICSLCKQSGALGPGLTGVRTQLIAAPQFVYQHYSQVWGNWKQWSPVILSVPPIIVPFQRHCGAVLRSTLVWLLWCGNTGHYHCDGKSLALSDPVIVYLHHNFLEGSHSYYLWEIDLSN